jgi:hypothetical protein
MESNISGIIPPGLCSFLKSNEDFVKVIRNPEIDFEKKTSYENYVKTPAEKTRMNRIQIDLEKEILASDEKWKVPEIMFGSEANEFSCDFAPKSSRPPAFSNFGKEFFLFLTFLSDFYRHRLFEVQILQYLMIYFDRALKLAIILEIPLVSHFSKHLAPIFLHSSMSYVS